MPNSPGGQPEMIPQFTQNFLVNSWSSDGTRLVGQVGAVGAVGRGIVVYSLQTRRYEQLTDFGEWPVWLPDNRRILFVAHGKAFYIVDSDTKEVREIFSVPRDVIGPPRLTRDGRWMFYSRRVTEADIWLLTLESRR
jgi:Tol biopolymer transport system component